jgi:CRP/FNR family cyclic AMP-dependent transcriptional regulator
MARLLASVPTDRLLAAGRVRTFGRGEVVFHQDDPGDALHHVISGRLSAALVTPSGDKVTLGVYGPGEVVGALAPLRPAQRRTATVSALEPAQTLIIGSVEFRRLREEYPAISQAVEDHLIELLTVTNERLLEALYLPAPVRVRRRLRDLAAVYRERPGPGPVSIAVSQESLADLAGTTRETVNRVLREEAERGAVTLRRREIVVDPDLLSD